MARVSEKGRYRPPSFAPRTAWARHIDAVHRERGWSQTKGFEVVGPKLKYSPKSRTGRVRKFMTGEVEPTEAEAKVLAEVYGWPHEEQVTEAPAPDLAAALTLLVEELRAMRQDRDRMEARMRALEVDIVDLRAEVRSHHGSPVSGGHPAQSSPRA